MYEFTSSILINRPQEDVFEAIMDPDKQPEWQSMLESMEWTSNGSTGVGSTMKTVSKFLGRKIEAEIEITTWDPPNRIDWKITNGPYPVDVTNELESQGAGTLLTSTSSAEFGGFFKLAEGLVGKQIKKQIDTNYESLKLLMESDQL